MIQIVGIFLILCLTHPANAQKSKLQCAPKIKSMSSCSIQNNTNKKLIDQSQQIKETCEKEHLSDEFLEALSKVSAHPDTTNLNLEIHESNENLIIINDTIKKIKSGKLNNQINFSKKIQKVWNKAEILSNQGKAELAEKEFEKYEKLVSEYDEKYSDYLHGFIDLNLSLQEIENQAYDLKKKINLLKKKKIALDEILKPTTHDATIKSAEIEQRIHRLNITFEVEEIKARKTFTDCGLTNQEIYAIMIYTGNYYSAINAALRSDDPNKLSELKPIIDAINSGLNKIKSFTNIVKRGADLPEEIELQHCLGCKIKYSAYTSSSTTESFSATSQFFIKSKNGKYIAPLSVNASEEEVLFAPGTNFKIINIESTNQVNKKYTMVEE